MPMPSLGPRAYRRSRPLLSITLAGAGSALVVLGAVTVAGDRIDGDDVGTDGVGAAALPGVLISAALLAGGLRLVQRHRSGPLATAGAVGSALAVPALWGFLVSLSSLDVSAVKTVLLLSALSWVAVYLWSPGRGRPFYLGAALLAAWVWIVDQIGSVGDVVFGATVGQVFPDETFGPSRTDVAYPSIVVGIGYLAAMRALDRRGLRGVGTPFVPAGLVAVVTGLLLLTPDLEAAGSGAVFAVFGVWLAYAGPRSERRFTTWFGGFLVAAGLVAIVGDAAEDNATGFGLALAVAGVAVVAAANALAAEVWPEPPEFDDLEPPDAPVDPVEAPSGRAGLGESSGAGEPDWPASPPLADHSGGSTHPDEPPPGPAG